MNHRRAGFSLVELLVVIAVSVLLIAILFPVLGSVRSQANTAESTSNLRSLGQATLAYAADNGGALPMLGNHPGYNDPPWYITLSDYIGITIRGGNSQGFYEEDARSILRNPSTSETDLSVNYAPSISCARSGSVHGRVLHIHEVLEPAKKAWLVTAIGSYSYNPFSDLSGEGSRLEYPHDGRANVLFFDGSVSLIPEQDVIDQGRELLDPRLN